MRVGFLLNLILVAATATCQPPPVADPTNDLVVAVGGTQSSQMATGTTLYRISGLKDANVIDGWLIASPDSGKIQKEPFGYVTVVEPDASRVEVSAETQDRRRLLVEKFGDGWRIMSTGPVWCDIDVYRTIQIDGRPFDFLAKRSELQFHIEGQKPDEENGDEEEEDDDSESPFSRDGLQVLIVYNSSDIMDTGQAEILFGAASLNWLDANCIKVDGQPAYRVLDKDTTGLDTDDEFLKALKLPRDSLPWLIVGNGKKGFSGPLPVSVDATIRLLEEYR